MDEAKKPAGRRPPKPSPLPAVGPSPHIRGARTTRSLMLDVIIALMPALIWAVFVFGARALTLTLAGVAACILFEAAYCLIMRKELTVGDLSCVVTGILISFNLPVSVPLWLPVLGGAFAIIIVKCLFGGLGKNIVNPALAARAFLFISFPKYMTAYPAVGGPKLPPFSLAGAASAAGASPADAIAGATPLASLKSGIIPTDVGLVNMLFGYKGGCIGEVSVLLLAVGGIYLLARRVITPGIPVAFIGVVAFVTYIFPKSPDSFNFMLYEVTAGGLFLGAIFMATDYATSPITRTGKTIYGALCGLITIFIRYFGGYPEGVSFAILLMNLFVWYIDKYTRPVRFGGAAREGKE